MLVTSVGRPAALPPVRLWHRSLTLCTDLRSLSMFVFLFVDFRNVFLFFSSFHPSQSTERALCLNPDQRHQ